MVNVLVMKVSSSIMYIMLKHLYFILSFSRRITFSGVLNSIRDVVTWEGWYTFKGPERDNSITLISFLKKNWTRIGFIIKLWDFTKSSSSQWFNVSPLFRAGLQLPAQWLHCIDFFTWFLWHCYYSWMCVEVLLFPFLLQEVWCCHYC